MNVRKVSQQLKIPISKIHYYEKMGLLKPERRANNYREYQTEDIRNLKLIILLKKYQFTLAEIRLVLSWNEKGAAWASNEAECRAFFQQKKEEMQKRIAFLEKSVELIVELPIFTNGEVTEENKYQRITTLIDELYDGGGA